MGESGRNGVALAVGAALLVVVMAAAAVVGSRDGRPFADVSSGEVGVHPACAPGEVVREEHNTEAVAKMKPPHFKLPNWSSPRAVVLASLDPYPKLNAIGVPAMAEPRFVDRAVIVIRDDGRPVARFETRRKHDQWFLARMTACASWVERAIAGPLECAPGQIEAHTINDRFGSPPDTPGPRTPKAAAEIYLRNRPRFLAILAAQKDPWQNPVVLREDGRIVAVLPAERINPDHYTIDMSATCDGP